MLHPTPCLDSFHRVPVNPRVTYVLNAGLAERFELFAWSEHLGNDDSSGHYVAIARHTDGGFRR